MHMQETKWDIDISRNSVETLRKHIMTSSGESGDAEKWRLMKNSAAKALRQIADNGT